MATRIGPDPGPVVVDRWWVAADGSVPPPTDPLRAALHPYARASVHLDPPVPVSFSWRPCGHRVDLLPTTNGCEVLVTAAAPAHGLTDRELDVWGLLAFGLSNAEIGRRLAVASRTVGTHVERVLAKLHVGTRAAAAALAVSGAGQVLPVVGGLDGLPDVPVVRLARAVQQGASARSRQALAPTRTPRTSRHPLLVGGLYPRGDLVPADGSMMRAGASLAVNQVNAAGGVHGRPVRHLAVEVDVNDAEAIRSGLRTLIDTGVDAVTLGYTLRRSRNDLGALFEQVAEAGIPLLHSQTSGLAPALVAENRHRFRGIFQVCAAETRYGVGFVRTLEELAATGAWRPRSRRIAVVDSRDPDLAVWSEEAHRAATDAGWHVTTRAEVDPLNPAWDAALSALRTGEDPAAILVGCFLPGALADFLHLHAAEPSPALLFATYAPSVPGFLDRAGPAAEGLLWSTVIGTRDGDVSARFVQAFRVASGHGPGRSSAGTHFDMVHLLAEAWARAENPLDRPSVLRNIARATHRGVNGLYAFDPVDLSVRAYPDDTLDPTLGMAHLVFRVRGGRHELISPLPYGARPVGVGRAR